MSKILIEGNKVIIDGHASDLKTCNTLTNLCDELSTSEKFRTVKYESGYGEFESVSDNEEKKFAGFQAELSIYSNDGTTNLFRIFIDASSNIEVTSTGMNIDGASAYTYAGDKVFLGFSNTANSTSATFSVGYTATAANIDTAYLYIVEGDPGYQVNLKSNDGTTILSQNSTVDSVVVTSAGAQLKCGDTVNATYTYSGSKLFAGLATSANATVPKYKPGDTIEITAETALYIVENIIIPDHHSSLTELFTNIAAVIREKTGDTASIVADEFPSVIRSSLRLSPFEPAGESYLTFSSPNSFTLKVNDTTKHWDGTLEYFASDRTWTVWDGTTTLSSTTRESDNVLYLRGIGNTVITGNDSNYKWVLTGSYILCMGDIENLLDYATVESGSQPTMARYCYAFMFQGCTALTQAPSLPATTLSPHCYSNMFSDCTGLTQAPTLPATTLSHYCYSNMFSDCTGLTQAPTLPATTLAENCYTSMFQNCPALTQAPSLPATTLSNYCYTSMFQNCTALTQAPSLPATTLSNFCYSHMFQSCTALTQAPSLPATNLKSDCYEYMFQGCTSLTQAPTLPVTTLAEGCYLSMFSGCTALTQAPTLPATNLKSHCYEDMFSGCTSLTQAPALHATTLTYYCYSRMFENCTSLTQAPALPATKLDKFCYFFMFSGCTSLTEIPVLPATTLANDCYHNMFYGCTKIKLSTNQTGEYTVAYRIPSSGTGTIASNALYHMFTSTGGTFTGTPSINTTYYLSNTNTVISPPVTLISFIVDGTTYQAEKGMTWIEWINSDYSQGEFSIRNLGSYFIIDHSKDSGKFDNQHEYHTNEEGQMLDYKGNILPSTSNDYGPQPDAVYNCSTGGGPV